MRTNHHNTIILALSFPLAILVIVASYSGLCIPDTYSQETVNWTVQAIGQDTINLFLITPFLMITSWLASKKNRIALLLWSGGIFYLIYTFVIYCFAVHFNQMFLVYCLILGLSFYSFLYFLCSHIKEPISEWFHDKIPVKRIGVYLFLFIAYYYHEFACPHKRIIAGYVFKKFTTAKGIIPIYIASRNTTSCCIIFLLSNFLPFSLTALKKLTGFFYQYCPRSVCEAHSVETIQGQKPLTPLIIPRLSTFLLRG